MSSSNAWGITSSWGSMRAAAPVTDCGKEHQQQYSLYHAHVWPTIVCPSMLRKKCSECAKCIMAMPLLIRECSMCTTDMLLLLTSTYRLDHRCPQSATAITMGDTSFTAITRPCHAWCHWYWYQNGCSTAPQPYWLEASVYTMKSACHLMYVSRHDTPFHLSRKIHHHNRSDLK